MTATSGVPLDLVQSAYEAAASPELWPRFLEQLAPRIRADTLQLVLRTSRPGVPTLAYAVGSDKQYAKAYVEQFAERDPWVARAGALAEGTVDNGECVLSPAELQRTEFYRVWMEPQGLRHPFGAILHKQPEGDCRSWLAGFRSDQAGPFDGEELGLVRALVPTLRRALALHRELRRAEMIRDAALETLDLLPEGWLLLAADGQVLAKNRRVDSILSDSGALRIEGERLRCDDDARAEHLRRLIARASEAGSAEASGGSLQLVGAGGSLRAVVAPLPAPTLSEQRPAVVLFVSAPEGSDAERARGLRELYGLTQAEARIGARLARGQRLSEIARDLGISINTVRGHLKQVFAKTGTHRQAELVRLVLSAPGRLQVA